MALIANTLDNTNFLRSLFGETVNETWTEQAQNVIIGRDESAVITLEYSGMNGTIDVKQADVVLVTYPLSYTCEDYTAADSLRDLDYYASKQSQDGPGMTYAIFSIVANAVSSSGCSAYTYQQYSYAPYIRAPWYQFSEQLNDDFSVTGFHPAFPFLTGHGGANQVVLFGYLGLRLIPTSWALHIDPALPPQIPHIRYRTFYWHGWPIMASSNQTHTTLSRSSNSISASGTNANATYATSPIPVVVGNDSSNTTYALSPNGTLIVPNRMYAYNLTTPGNALQCHLASSTQEIVPGQFALAANDGATSTKWQPADAAANATITIEIPAENIGKPLRGLHINWASRPAWNYSVETSNSSTSTEDAREGGRLLLAQGAVNISAPWSEADADDPSIALPIGNETEVSFDSNREMSYLGKFASLTVWGHRFDDNVTDVNMQGDGATVAEWELLLELDEAPSRRRRGVGAELELDVKGKLERRVGAGPEVTRDMRVRRRSLVEEKRLLGLAGRDQARRRVGFAG
jgi:hypothetical protein